MLAAIVLAAALLHVFLGSSSSSRPFQLNLHFADVLKGLLAGPNSDDSVSLMIWQLRVPRMLACVLVGGILGAVGSAFQALFRNPLADPYIVGASSGAAVGGALAILLGIASWAMGFGTLILTFMSGFGALFAVIGLARVRGVIDTQRLLLAGVVIGTFLSSVVAMLLLLAGKDSNQVLRWLLGSVTPMFWPSILPLAIALIVGVIVLTLLGRRLNVLATGEETAHLLGINVHRLRATVLCVGTAMTAVAVGTVGIVGFLGLVAPHIARKWIGVDWRVSLPGASMVGMALLTIADSAAQWLIPGAEIPVGVVTAIFGSPILLMMLRSEANDLALS